MTTPVVTFFNNKGGVGKTTLVYHLAWMLQEIGVRVVAVDLDPQANLTASFLSDEEIEKLWAGTQRRTVYGALEPLFGGTGGIMAPHIRGNRTQPRARSRGPAVVRDRAGAEHRLAD
ncbi:MAG TPA: AAA family ATPase [Trebonia sp.]|jgi:cellulose biosynthesis protein BcsQ